jgi:SAM-dependent methyltransferase
MKITENLLELEAIFQGGRKYWTDMAKIHGAINHPSTQFSDVVLNAATAEDILRGYTTAELSEVNVLDFGCGEGRLIPYIAPRVKSYSGLDASSSCVSYARTVANAYPNAMIYELTSLNDLYKMDFKDIRLFMSWTVFQHIPHSLMRHIIRAISASMPPYSCAHLQMDWPPLVGWPHPREEQYRFTVMEDDDYRCRWWPPEVIYETLEAAGWDVWEKPDAEHQCWRAVRSDDVSRLSKVLDLVS